MGEVAVAEVARPAEVGEERTSAVAIVSLQPAHTTDSLADPPFAVASSFPLSAIPASRRAGNWIDEMALEIGQASVQEVGNHDLRDEPFQQDSAAVSASAAAELVAASASSAAPSPGAGRAECPVCLDGY